MRREAHESAPSHFLGLDIGVAMRGREVECRTPFSESGKPLRLEASSDVAGGVRDEPK